MGIRMTQLGDMTKSDGANDRYMPHGPFSHTLALHGPFGPSSHPSAYPRRSSFVMYSDSLPDLVVYFDSLPSVNPKPHHNPNPDPNPNPNLNPSTTRSMAVTSTATTLEDSPTRMDNSPPVAAQAEMEDRGLELDGAIVVANSNPNPNSSINPKPSPNANQALTLTQQS